MGPPRTLLADASKTAWRSSITANAIIDADVPRRAALARDVGYAPPAVGPVTDIYRTGVAPTVNFPFCKVTQFMRLTSPWQLVPIRVIARSRHCGV